MCNIAGYIGSRPAAPILIEMLRREEGWNAGFYTGIATIHNGKIHCAKLTGDLDHLLKNTNAGSLPGTIGVIHSRTASGGGDEWSHPFIGESGGREILAYVANGSRGCFTPHAAEATRLAGELESSGYRFRSRENNPVGLYPALPDGGAAHMSDVMAQLITRNIDRGADPSTAMDAAFCEMPSEIVGLLLSLAEPDCIHWSRINMPMFVGFADHGAYLASTPQAFPCITSEPTLLPANSGGRIYPDHFTASPYKNSPGTVAPITPQIVSAAYAQMEQNLKNDRLTMPQLNRQTKSLFEQADCCPSAALTYSILYSFQRENRLMVSTETQPGMHEGLTAPLFWAKLK